MPKLSELLDHLATVAAGKTRGEYLRFDTSENLRTLVAALREAIEVLEVYAYPIPETADRGKQAFEWLDKWNKQP